MGCCGFDTVTGLMSLVRSLPLCPSHRHGSCRVAGVMHFARSRVLHGGVGTCALRTAVGLARSRASSFLHGRWVGSWCDHVADGIVGTTRSHRTGRRGTATHRPHRPTAGPTRWLMLVSSGPARSQHCLTCFLSSPAFFLAMSVVPVSLATDMARKKAGDGYVTCRRGCRSARS